MHFWLVTLPWRSLYARTVTAALVVALLLATLYQSQAADPEPKRVLILHSVGRSFGHGMLMRRIFELNLIDSRAGQSTYKNIRWSQLGPETREPRNYSSNISKNCTRAHRRI